MRLFGKPCLSLPCIVAVSTLLIQAGYAQPPTAATSTPPKLGGAAVGDILQRLGAKFEQGSDSKQLDDYANHFNRTDLNRDGKHTKEEYVDNGSYMTPQARAGIFRAADGNADGVVTKAEYVLNRIITDELTNRTLERLRMIAKGEEIPETEEKNESSDAEENKADEVKGEETPENEE